MANISIRLPKKPKAKPWIEVHIPELPDAYHRVNTHRPNPEEFNEDNHVLLFKEIPQTKEGMASKFRIWWSECGRYRIGLRRPEYTGANAYEPDYVACVGMSGPIISSGHKSLEAAINSVTKYHAKVNKYKKRPVTSNIEDILPIAEKLKLDQVGTKKPEVKKPNITIEIRPKNKKKKIRKNKGSPSIIVVATDSSRPKRERRRSTGRKVVRPKKRGV